MKVGDLSGSQVAKRLRREGLLLRVGPLVTRLQVTLRGISEHIHFLYADTPLEEDPCLIDFEVKLAPETWLRGALGRRAALHIDGSKVFGSFKASVAMPMLEWCLNGCVFNRPNQYLILHSAVLARDGLAAIMPGPPGWGKSTLCAALSLRGWRLLSDEVALIRPADRQIMPVPRPVGLKEGSIDIIRRFDANAKVGRAWPGTRKGTVAHMRPPVESLARADEPATPAWIICPRYEADAKTRLWRIPNADAFLHVAHDAFNYSLLGHVGFETLANTVEQCDCYAFVYSDLEEAITAFNGLLPPESPSARISA